MEATGAAVVVNAREADAVRAASRTLIDAVDGGDIAIGRRGVRALETPGHTVGGTCYLADGYIVTGDLLFVGGCGRTDFRGGDTAEMWRSLQRLTRLPEETRVYPGHDYGQTPTSTIGQEVADESVSALPDVRGISRPARTPPEGLTPRVARSDSRAAGDRPNG